MRLTRHPEYAAYRRDQATDRRCRLALSAWRASDQPILAETYSMRWTFADAQTFVRSISLMFQAYNRVLWERFPYCRQCRGQCCAVGGTYVGLLDLVAIALLDRPLPALGSRSRGTVRNCIYLTATQCAWPSEWKPIKCWLFYCLGSEQWALSDSVSERYGAVAGELRDVVAALWPEQLRQYEAIQGCLLLDRLDNPFGFASVFGDAVSDLLIAPFNDRYPVMDPERGTHFREVFAPQSPDDVASHALAFIAEAVEQIGEREPSASSDGLLADLGALEWILLGRPGDGLERIQEMARRYAGAPGPGRGERATIEQRMRQHLLDLQKHWI